MERNMLVREIDSLMAKPVFDHFINTALPFAVLSNSNAPSYHGHPIKGDYSSGIVTENIEIKNSLGGNLKTESKNILYFLKGTKVAFISSKNLMVQVAGQAHYMDGSTFVPYSRSVDYKTLETVGWIDRLYTNMPLGKFDNIEIIDTSKYIRKVKTLVKTVRFGQSPLLNYKYILMHKTEGSLKSVKATYKDRVKAISDIGSHYLIDEDGKIYLTGGIDEKLSHTASDIDSSINNSNSIGIEHVGFADTINDYPKKKFVDRISEIRKQLEKLSLSPQFKETLLSKNDYDLFKTLRDHIFKIHNDISSQQKRASYILTKNLRIRFSLGIDAIKAHEVSAIKTTGEGANTVEFHRNMEEYPNKFKILNDLIDNVLSKSNQTTLTTAVNLSLKMVGQLIRIKMTEEEFFKAINLDATNSENADLKKGEPSAALREKLRTQFYDSFYLRMQQSDNLIAALQHPNSKVIKVSLYDAIANWQF
jgi:hypothetical protein